MNSLGYYPGGLVIPRHYYAYSIPYGVPAGGIGSLYMAVLSTVVASFDQKQFTLRRCEADGSYTAINFEFYVSPTVAPSLPTIGIDLTGLTTLAQIRNEIALAVSSVGFFAPAGSTSRLRITQPFPGSQGDVAFFGDFGAGGLLEVESGPGWITVPPLSLHQYGDTMFWGGTELSVPLRIGVIMGMAPTVSPIVNNGSIVP